MLCRLIDKLGVQFFLDARLPEDLLSMQELIFTKFETKSIYLYLILFIRIAWNMEEIHDHGMNQLLHHDVLWKVFMECGVWRNSPRKDWHYFIQLSFIRQLLMKG